jgi:hypothetical protein
MRAEFSAGWSAAARLPLDAIHCRAPTARPERRDYETLAVAMTDAATPGPGATREEVAYEAAQRALELQSDAFKELRARTGTLLAAASLAASFLGGQAIRAAGLGPLSIIGLLAFLATVIPCLYLLLPEQKLHFGLEGGPLYERLYRDGVEAPAEVHRVVAYWLDDVFRANLPRLHHLFRVYTAAAAALGLEVIFWALQIAAKL